MSDVVKEKKKMGRKVTLTPDKIISTIKALQDDSSDVTPCIIRKKIGFGGLGNITKVMETFLQNQTGISLSESEPKEAHILPPDLEDKRNMLLTDLTLQVSNFAIESDLLANNLAEKKARSAYENIIQNNQKIADELTQTIKMFDEIEVKNDALNEQIITVETRLENEQAKLSALEGNLSKSNNELDRLNQLILEKQESLAKSDVKIKSLEKLITKTETRLESSITDKEIAVNETIKIRNELAETSSKLKSSEAIVDQLKSDIGVLRAEKDQSTSKLQETQSEYQINKEQLITITTQFSSQKDVLNEKNERIIDLKKQLTESKTIK